VYDSPSEKNTVAAVSVCLVNRIYWKYDICSLEEKNSRKIQKNHKIEKRKKKSKNRKKKKIIKS